MSCEQHSESIMKYFDGTLNDIEIKELKQHIKTCGKCNEEFEELSTILGFIENDNFIEPPEDFEIQVMTRIQRLEPNENRRLEMLMICLLGIATVFSLVLSAAFTYSVLGVSLFKLGGHIISAYTPFVGFVEMVGSVFRSVTSPVVNVAKALMEIGIGIATNYYYIVVLLVVLLFAVQWMFVSLIRQNKGGAAK